jgi:hypothetical protein
MKISFLSALIILIGLQNLSFGQDRRIQLDFYHNPLYDIETAIDYKLAIDNAADFGLAYFGDTENENSKECQKNPAYRFFHHITLSTVAMITNRIVHERAHIIAYEELTNDKLALNTRSVFFSTIKLDDEILTVNQLIQVAAAGINSSYRMSNKVIKNMMRSRNGYLIDWMNFLFARGDDLLQWASSRVADGNSSDVDRYGYKFDSEWGFNEPIPSSNFYRSLPIYDNSLYTTFLHIKRYGINLDKDLAALLVANLGTAYTWQAIYALLCHLGAGELNQKPWMLGESSAKVSFPIITNYRTVDGYFYDAKMYFDFRDVKHHKLPLAVLHFGHDLDSILGGGVNRLRVGFELIDFITISVILDSLRIHPYAFFNFERGKGSFDGYYVGAKVEQTIYKGLGAWVDVGYAYNDLIENNVFLYDNKWKIKFGLFLTF